MILSQAVPDMFWRVMPPDTLEAWIKQRVPAEMAPQLARGMETARFKQAQQLSMQKAAEAAITAHSTTQ
jgi:aminopeptidase N